MMFNVPWYYAVKNIRSSPTPHYEQYMPGCDICGRCEYASGRGVWCAGSDRAPEAIP